MTQTITIELKDDFITLAQALKYANVIGSGGQAKWFLQEYAVYLNGELEDRRGKKLYRGDQLLIPVEELTILIAE